MSGQGCPSAPRRRRALGGWLLAPRPAALRALCLFACAAACLASGTAEAGETIRVRLAWGGGTPRQWRGIVALDQNGGPAGTAPLGDPRPLGIEADEPGSMWIEGEVLRIEQRSPRAYDGVDVTVEASLDRRLVVSMAAPDSDETQTVEIPIRDLLADFQERPLDDQGNRLFVRRAPGDSLRLRLDRDVLIFSPGEVLNVAVLPHLLPVEAGTTVSYQAQLQAARDDEELWSHSARRVFGLPATGPPEVALQVPLPEVEGVYNLVVKASPVELRARFGLPRVVASRKLQVVVLAEAAPAEEEAAEWETVVEIDPANPSWWKRLANVPVPWLGSEPRSSGDTSVWDHSLGRLSQFGPRGREPDIAWAAYPLPVEEPGRPHILEVEYPGDLPQTLGISVLEPNAGGQLLPIGLDSGVYLPVEAAARSATMQTHRLLFWPRTTSPLVLLTNRRHGSRAAFGKIRLLAGPRRLPPSPVAGTPAGRRWWAYLDKPLLPENFTASDALDEFSGRGLDDWRTFHEAGTRMADYLRHVGYTGAMLTVAADGGGLYPSRVLRPTPRYDSGTFFASGQDPVRKDALELVFRLFDRSQLELVPAIDFSAPLPELEEALRDPGVDTTGIRWVGANGAEWLDTHAARNGLAPYYNVLHPRVQQAMLRVVRELALRYGNHASFAGAAVKLSAQGYAQLPGAEWGFDDATVARFQHETGMVVPGAGPGRFAQRAAFLLGPQRRLWLNWRAYVLQNFYAALQREIAAVRPGARLYLAGGGMFQRAELKRKLEPALPLTTRVQPLLLELGVDPRRFAELPGVVLMRPHAVAPRDALPEQSVALDLDHELELDAALGMASRAALFYHVPLEARLQSGEDEGPIPGSSTWLAAEPLPSDDYNRKRFVDALAATDAASMVDGGWLLPLGQEEAVKEMIAAFRQLPAARFDTLRQPVGSPLTIRHLTAADRTYVYLVNNSGRSCRVRLRAEAPAGCRLHRLGTAPAEVQLSLSPDGAAWEPEVEPYGLWAGWFSAPGVVLSEPHVQPDEQLLAELEARITDLTARAAALRKPQPLETLRNGGFEETPEVAGRLPGWTLASLEPVTARLDDSQKYDGDFSVRLQSSGPVVSLQSDVIETPRTGRLAISVFLKTADPARQPPLRLAIDGLLYGQSYYRSAPVGFGQAGARQIGDKWAWYIFPVNDLPRQGLTQLRVRFDLMGPGDVWLDNVQVYDLHFSKTEVIVLSKLIALANIKLQQGQVAECLRLLDGYWPQFLLAHVPRPSIAAPPAPAETAPDADEPPKEPEDGFFERVNRYIPGWMRF